MAIEVSNKEVYCHLLQTEVDTDTLMPKEEFLPQVVEWCKSIGSVSTKV